MIRLFRLFSKFPLFFLHFLGAGLGWIAFVASPVYRRRFMGNAALAGYSFKQVWPAIGHAGKMVAELPRLWQGAPVPVLMKNTHCLDRAYAAGRGVVLLAPHLGCFEIAPQMVAEKYAEQYGALTILYRPARQAWLAKIMQHARHRPGLQAVPTNMMGVRHMLKALRQGKAVGLLPDQVPPDGMGLWAPFFGQDAYTMSLAARLVQQTGATLVLGWTERLSWGRGFVVHVVDFKEPLAVDLSEAVMQINKSMEALICQAPSQYLWGYARYKQPRKESV